MEPPPDIPINPAGKLVCLPADRHAIAQHINSIKTLAEIEHLLVLQDREKAEREKEQRKARMQKGLPQLEAEPLMLPERAMTNMLLDWGKEGCARRGLVPPSSDAVISIFSPERIEVEATGRLAYCFAGTFGGVSDLINSYCRHIPAENAAENAAENQSGAGKPMEGYP